MPENSEITIDNRFVDKVRSNIKSDFIEITEDKLENILLKHLDKLTKVNSWITPLSLFITIFTVLLTVEFRNFANIDKSVWEAVFIICFLGTFIWTIVSSIQAIKCSKKASIEYLIKEIKNNRE